MDRGTKGTVVMLIFYHNFTTQANTHSPSGALGGSPTDSIQDTGTWSPTSGTRPRTQRAMQPAGHLHGGLETQTGPTSEALMPHPGDQEHSSGLNKGAGLVPTSHVALEAAEVNASETNFQKGGKCSGEGRVLKTLV